MTVFFTGWIGYGSVIQGGLLVEPSDAGYMRRPFVLGDLDNGLVSDIGGGTVGPAVTQWGQVSYMGLFDQQTGGNLLLWMGLPLPLTIGANGTITSGAGGYRFLFPDLRSGHLSVLSWPAGTAVARSADGRPLVAGVALQVVAGRLTAQSPIFGTNVTMADLPAVQPASGSGLLWNNGGIISIA